MHNNHFSFQRTPFSSAPDVTGYFPAASMESARLTVLHVLENVTGIPLVFGESGMGKSLLLRMLEKTLENDCHVIYMANRRLRSPKFLYQHLLFSVHQSWCGMDENELRLLFLDHLRQGGTHSILLLVDEAHSMARSVLEELRVLLHYNEENRAIFRLVLAGDHRFEDHLTHPHLNAFQQQVVARCYLEKFRREETCKEILWQLKMAGCEIPDLLFLPEACQTVHQLTDGVPRVVHQLCQQSLNCAASWGLNSIDETVVRTAWNILQQLPGSETTMSDGNFGFSEFKAGATKSEALSPKSEVTPLIEFGILDEDESGKLPLPITSLESLHHQTYCRPAFDHPFNEMFDVPLVAATKTTESESEFDMTFKIPSETSGLTSWEDALSDRVPSHQKQPEPPQRESCQKLLDELTIMEQLLSQEISVINKMRKIESDCLSRRAGRVSPTQILAGFPEMSTGEGQGKKCKV